MKYNLPAVQQADLQSAETPYLGGEFAVYVSRSPSYMVGEIDMSNSGTGSGANANASYSPALGITLIPGDVQIGVYKQLKSAVACTVIMNVTDENNLVRTASATFTPPARAAFQDYNFPRGIAQDLLLDNSGPGVQIVSIQGIQSIVGGSRGVAFRLWNLPQAASFVLVGTTTDKKFNLRTPAPVGIDDGMEADAFIKLGKSNKGELTIQSKFVSFAEKLARVSGARLTAMLIGLKEGVLQNDRAVFPLYIPTTAVNLPDGDGEAMEDIQTGKFNEALFFVAP